MLGNDHPGSRGRISESLGHRVQLDVHEVEPQIQCPTQQGTSIVFFSLEESALALRPAGKNEGLGSSIPEALEIGVANRVDPQLDQVRAVRRLASGAEHLLRRTCRHRCHQLSHGASPRVDRRLANAVSLSLSKKKPLQEA
jgi:hypothetical protein